jgi:hypothetical protein
MGFKNSVSLAQHVHRCIVGRALRHVPFKGEAELRKDRTFTTSNPCFRIYLDKFGELCKVSKKVADAIEGKVSPLVAGLGEEYLDLGVRLRPKKGVASRRCAEVQGAVVDGEAGLAFPKPEKTLKYTQLGLLLLEADQRTQKQAQVYWWGICVFLHVSKAFVGVPQCVVEVHYVL